jgi:hypothetical protein
MARLKKLKTVPNFEALDTQVGNEIPLLMKLVNAISLMV